MYRHNIPRADFLRMLAVCENPPRASEKLKKVLRDARLLTQPQPPTVRADSSDLA